MTESYANLWLEGYKSARFRGKHFVKSFLKFQFFGRNVAIALQFIFQERI